MLTALNRELWERCFALIDPKLVEKGAVRLASYTASLSAFKRHYGSIKPWHVRLSLHLPPHANKHDRRPFAYVYVVWQDERHGFHMFRERWVKDHDQWYTRVVGLVVQVDSAMKDTSDR
jgi:hypothetical protein